MLCFSLLQPSRTKLLLIRRGMPGGGLATNCFRPYLFGDTFTLVTDHEPLKWLMTTHKVTRKMVRWSPLLQEYDFTVQIELERRMPMRTASATTPSHQTLVPPFWNGVGGKSYQWPAT